MIFLDQEKSMTPKLEIMLQINYFDWDGLCRMLMVDDDSIVYIIGIFTQTEKNIQITNIYTFNSIEKGC